jgi:opine dehydrogenase
VNLAVIGAGGGGLVTAAEAALAGWQVTIADLPEFGTQIDAVAAAGGVHARIRDGATDEYPTAVFTEVAASKDPVQAMTDVPLVIVSVPAFGHKPFAELLSPVLQDRQQVIWTGEGGGAFTMIAELGRLGRRPKAVIGETNTLPYGVAYPDGPGRVTATRKRGGSMIAAIPTGETDRLFDSVAPIWPWVTKAQNAWETVLVNFNAIDHVAAMICNLGSIETEGEFRPWGEGATPGVTNVIGAVDSEYLKLRKAIGLDNEMRYEEYLVAQGMAQSIGASLHETIRSSLLGTVVFEGGPAALEHRFVAEDVPYSLVLASSIGVALGVETPVIDGLIALASAAAQREYRTEGRTLADWGLAGADADALRKAVDRGRW